MIYHIVSAHFSLLFGEILFVSNEQAGVVICCCCFHAFCTTVPMLASHRFKRKGRERILEKDSTEKIGRQKTQCPLNWA